MNDPIRSALVGIVDSANDLLNEMARNPGKQGNWGGLAAHVQIARAALNGPADDCTGCARAPTPEEPTYDEECMGCSRFYGDLFAPLDAPVPDLDSAKEPTHAR